jgi:hypothetical protein
MEKGLKNDIVDGKLRWDLLPIDMIEEIVKAYTAGAVKYSANSWQEVENGTERYYAALLRHLVEWRKGNEIDSDTGCKHMAQVAWNAITLMWLDKNKK